MKGFEGLFQPSEHLASSVAKLATLFRLPVEIWTSVYDSVKRGLRPGTLTNIPESHRFLSAQYRYDVELEWGPVSRTLDVMLVPLPHVGQITLGISPSFGDCLILPMVGPRLRNVLVLFVLLVPLSSETSCSYHSDINA